MSVLHHSDGDIKKLANVDRDIHNGWRWDWLERKVIVDVDKICPELKWHKGPLTMLVKGSIRKIDLPGKAIYTLCPKNDPIRYGCK